MAFIIGNKIGMTQMFDAGTGNAMAVTLIEARPCTVTFVRTKERDGYYALQVGCGTKKKMNKPERGHLGSAAQCAVLREFRLRAPADKNVGDVIDVSVFHAGDVVKVSGISKAKGFQGVVKRHGFRGGPASHGQKHSLREPGSIGAVWPQRVLKGMRMAGRMGGDMRTVRNLAVVAVDAGAGTIAVAGAVPGRKGTLLAVRS